MGFFDAVGKILAGKPVFTPEGEAAKGSTDSPQATNAEPAGRKEVPEVRILRVESRISGGRMDVYADIHNGSSDALFLDRVLLLGTKRELDAQLLPGQAKQFVLYSGPLFMHQPTGYAELQYRKQADGDYFANYHQIRSRQSGSEGFEITELLQQGPVKDI